jgi:hypothetical protein
MIPGGEKKFKSKNLCKGIKERKEKKKKYRNLNPRTVYCSPSHSKYKVTKETKVGIPNIKAWKEGSKEI